ncbi:MAG TPA: DNA-binding response regulator, partial [Ktedonobacteraceae bacterium]
YAQEALRAGAIDYLLKPVRPEQLEALLQKLCADLHSEKTQETFSSAPPDQASTLSLDSPHIYILKLALAFIAAHYTQHLTLEQVAKQVALSSTYFSRIFKQETGYTFVEYLTRLRLEEVKRLLRTTRLSLAEISYAVGYQNPNYLSERFKALEGVTPGAYRRNLDSGS